VDSKEFNDFQKNKKFFLDKEKGEMLMNMEKANLLKRCFGKKVRLIIKNRTGELVEKEGIVHGNENWLYFALFENSGGGDEYVDSETLVSAQFL